VKFLVCLLHTEQEAAKQVRTKRAQKDASRRAAKVVKNVYHKTIKQEMGGSDDSEGESEQEIDPSGKNILVCCYMRCLIMKQQGI
jgi:hypothetical protein